MTWEELCEKAKKMGYTRFFDDPCEQCGELDKNGLRFFKNGKIKTDMNDIVSKYKSTEQMYQIMLALED